MSSTLSPLSQEDEVFSTLVENLPGELSTAVKQVEQGGRRVLVSKDAVPRAGTRTDHGRRFAGGP